MLHQLLLRGLHIGALALEVVGDGAAQGGVGEVVGGIGGDGAVAARQLVLALRAGLDALQAARDREVDGLVVADLEMQERMVLDAAPVAAVERVGADEVERARRCSARRAWP